MILTKRDLQEYINADKSRYEVRHPKILGYILQDESYKALKFLNALRHVEYYLNCKPGLFWKPLYLFWVLVLRWRSAKTHIRISPNVVGKGLYIPHFGGGVIINAKSLGDYCIVSTGVVIGNKGDKNSKPTLGNKVEVTIGSKVIGNIVVGDNVTIAPNSVVVKDVPDNCVVSGVPASILKYK